LLPRGTLVELRTVERPGVDFATVRTKGVAVEGAWVESPEYAAPMWSVPDPTADGVNETTQTAWFEPTEDTLQGLVGLKLPGPSAENVTWPIGLVAPIVAVSATVAVHDVPMPTTTGEEHDTTVVVGSLTTGRVTVAP